MNAAEAMARLKGLGAPLVTTADAALLFRRSTDAANKTLARLARAGLMAPVRRGLWAIGDRVEPLVLPPYLTAPYPSYVSLQSALYRHGMISQMPAMIYVVSLEKSRRLRTRFGTFSVHRVAPQFFGGFATDGAGVNLATPEKALIDVFYLSSTRSRRFADLPELELSATFRVRSARGWIARIPSLRLRTIVTARLDAVLRARRADRRR